MKILVCNERFLFRFGVDRVLLLLGSCWKSSGHEIIMMGNKLDPKAVDKCSDAFIQIPEALDYLHGNDFTLEYLEKNWDNWFDDTDSPDAVLVAGWPFYRCIRFLRERCGCVIFHDYGAVPLAGMSEPQKITQMELRRLRRENLKYANRVVAISRFLEESQSRADLENIDCFVPTSYVHLGADHLDLLLWDKDELQIDQNDVIANIKKFKKEGYKIIFQPGRWENDNYKNSAAGVELIKTLRRNHIRHKILVLSSRKDMAGVPDELSASYYCLGYIDDSTMQRVMELSDAGFSPTLWEGFDLPLAEMQYLDKYMFVLNVGAHPEVVVHPYFLCKDMAELGNKLIDALNGNLPFSYENYLQYCDTFRRTFTWENSASRLLLEIENAVFSSVTVLMDVTNACHDTANSGVMRVTRKLAHYLQNKVNTVFVMWDESINKYVFPYEEEVRLLCSYGGPDASKIKYRSKEGQTRYLLDNAREAFIGRKIHLFTETVNYKILQKATEYFHSNGIAVAAVFHDAIAVLRPELCAKEVSENHKKYMLELAKCDAVIPTAAHNQKDLEQYWEANTISRTNVFTAELAAEMDGVGRAKNKVKVLNDAITILFVSTLEPRKNHIRFLKAFERMLRQHPDLEQKVQLHLIGNRYTGNDEIPDFVEHFCIRHKNVHWLGVVDDEILKNEYADCTFTVYPSEIEGFGMPVIESLWFGKPCLCNCNGSIGELGSRGGCCLTDVLSEESMSDSLYKMVTDKEYLIHLQHEAVEREITTWDQYADSVCRILSEIKPDQTEYQNHKFPVEISQAVKEYFRSWNGRRIITVSNCYPPNILGGAEIIAHNQAKTFMEEMLARVIAFSVNISSENIPGSVTMEYIDNVLVIRSSVLIDNFKGSGINFFNESINSAFEELCSLAEPDIVHCHNIIGTSLGIVDIAKKAGAKVCVTLHDNWGFCYKNTMLDHYGKLCKNVLNCSQCMPDLTAGGINIPIEVRRAYFRRIFEKIDAYISPSQYLADNYIRAGFDFHKMNVIWNGIDVDKFLSVKKVPSEKIRITVVAAFEKHKGIGILLEAVRMLGREDVEINLVGAGSETEKYRQDAAEYGILHQLKFWGKLDNQDIGRAYAETDIYCLPSIWPENQPVSITEAMACGLPVVASDLGGSKELVKDGVTGFVFHSGDAQNLAAKLGILAKDKNLRKQFGEAGRDAIRQNTYKQQIRKINALFDQIVTEEFTSKKIIAVKGNVMPRGIASVTDKDVLLWDWILLEKEYSDVLAVVILFGEKMTGKELEQLKEKEIPVFSDAREYKEYEKKGLYTVPYQSERELLAKLSEI